MTLEIGDKAPEFALQSDENKTVELSDFRGQRVLIFFYPKADTPGCTTQACGFRDNFPLFEDAGAVVLGISPDPVQALTKWRAKENLPYNLLSDEDHTVAEAYGVWGEKKMYGKTYFGIIRSHFAVDAEGRLTEVKLKVKPLTTADLALKLVAL